MPFQKGHKVNLGRRLSKEHKEKIRLAILGKEYPHRQGKLPSNWEKVKNYFVSEPGKPRRKLKGQFKKGISWEEKYGKEKAEKMKVSASLRFKDKKQSIKHRYKRHLSQLGKKGSNWKGGKTKESKLLHTNFRWDLWRHKVFKRDNYTCQRCHKEGGYLEPHHIKPVHEYPNLIYVVSNGLTLCEGCHIKVDKYKRRFVKNDRK